MNTTERLLADMPMLRFLCFQMGFIAAFKDKGRLPKVIKKYGLKKPYPFLIIPSSPMPNLGVPYFAHDINIDEDHPEWTLRGVTYYRCRTDSNKLVLATEESISKHLSNSPLGHTVRKLYVINGGKK